MVEPDAEIDGELRRDLHLVLYEGAGLPASLLAVEDDRTWYTRAEIRSAEMDVGFVDLRQVGEVDPRLAQVIQVLTRTQHHEINSALHRVATRESRDVALHAKRPERPFCIGLCAVGIDGVGE